MDEFENETPLERRKREDFARESGMEVETPAQTIRPSFKYSGKARIPVSERRGLLWAARKSQALAKRENRNLTRAWQLAREYYENNQLNTRHEGADDPNRVRSAEFAKLYKAGYSETENVVFSNINAQLPYLYAQNPRVEVTPYDISDEERQAGATIIERVLFAIADTKFHPGINLKPKIHRAILLAMLTNSAYLEFEGTARMQSSEQAVAELQAIAKKLQEAKTEAEIIKYEGELIALEENVSFLRSSGVTVRVLNPEQVLRDPTGDADLSNCQWVMVQRFMQTSVLNAMFGEQRDKGGQVYQSVYKPSHILPSSNTVGDVDNPASTFHTYEDNEEYNAKYYGYDDKYTFDRAKYTKCWYVWDKVTRRVELYADNDWKFPIWVWDDPYKLPGFFPLVHFQSYQSLDGGEAKGETVYYLDQQDGINFNNMMKAKWRARGEIIGYNSDKIQNANDVQRWIDGAKNVQGFPVPEGMKIEDLFFTLIPPTIKFAELYDNSAYHEAIDRITGVNAALQSMQFKTNTTNDAIAQYSSAVEGRLSYKKDGLDDALAETFRILYHMARQFLDAAALQPIVGNRIAAAWGEIAADERWSRLGVQIVPGSTQKPNTENKRREAIEVGQVLGQFASASPAVILVILQLFERAFDSFVVSSEDWKAIRDSLMQMLMNKQGGAPGQNSPRPQPTEPNGPPSLPPLG